MFEIVTDDGRTLGPFTARQLREAAEAMPTEQGDGWDVRVVEVDD